MKLGMWWWVTTLPKSMLSKLPHEGDMEDEH